MSERAGDTGQPEVARPKTWMLARGWCRHGLLDPAEVPGRKPGRRALRCYSRVLMVPGEIETIARITAREHVLIAASRSEGGTMDELPDKVAALLEVSRALRALGASHALVGGVAVGIRSGVPRATLDTDFAVHSSVERVAVVRALTSAGLSLRGEFAHSVNFRHPSGEPVQLVFDPEFDPMIDRAEPIAVGGTTVPVVTKADLITMKERAASDPARRRSKALRDAADLALLRGDVPDPDEGW